MLKISKQNAVSAIIFMSVYFILLTFSGYYFFEYTALEGRILIFALLVCLILLGRNSASKNIFMTSLLLLANVLVTELLTGFDSISVLLMAVTLVEVAVFVCIIPFEEFIDKYIKCMAIIAIVSLIGNIFLILSPGVLFTFPQIVNSKQRSSTFLIFGMISDFRMTGAYRNQGIFWEPGAYQVFLCLAYIFELYSDHERKRKIWRCMLFIVSMISTVSTTGIIVAVALIILTVGRNKGRASIIKVGVVFVIVIFGIAKVLPNLEGFWEYTLITKIDQVLNYTPGVSNEASSRMDSVFYVLKAFMKSPIIGIGSGGYSLLGEQVGHTMFTCTPVNWLAAYGILWGGFVYVNLAKLFQRITGNYFEAIIALVLLCISVFSEEFSTNPFFMILIFYGMENRVRVRSVWKD